MLFPLHLLRTMLLVAWLRLPGLQASRRLYCKMHLFPHHRRMQLSPLALRPVPSFAILTTLICSQALVLTHHLHLGVNLLLLQPLPRRTHWRVSPSHRSPPGNHHRLRCQQMQRGECHHRYDKAQLLRSLSMESDRRGHNKVLVSPLRKSNNASVTTASKQSSDHWKITWWPRLATTIA